jgi:hypothetical protein
VRLVLLPAAERRYFVRRNAARAVNSARRLLLANGGVESPPRRASGGSLCSVRTLLVLAAADRPVGRPDLLLMFSEAGVSLVAHPADQVWGRLAAPGNLRTGRGQAIDSGQASSLLSLNKKPLPSTSERPSSPTAVAQDPNLGSFLLSDKVRPPSTFALLRGPVACERRPAGAACCLCSLLPARAKRRDGLPRRPPRERSWLLCRRSCYTC